MQDHIPGWIRENRQVARANHRLGLVLEKVLEHGGYAICRLGETLPSEISSYLKKGMPWPTRYRLFKRMQSNRCHENVAGLWSENMDQLDICTGFALTDPEEGLWRSHSWCWQFEEERVVETTFRYKAYWGFVLDQDQAQDFMRAQLL